MGIVLGVTALFPGPPGGRSRGVQIVEERPRRFLDPLDALGTLDHLGLNEGIRDPALTPRERRGRRAHDVAKVAHEM